MQREDWSEQPDGSRNRIEHLVTWQDEQAAQVVVMGVDASCRPVYITVLSSSA
jgi:hypothetical protein